MKGGEQEDLLEHQGGQEIGAVEGGFVQKRGNGSDDEARVTVKAELQKWAFDSQFEHDKGHEERPGDGKQATDIGGVPPLSLSLGDRQQ